MLNDLNYEMIYPSDRYSPEALAAIGGFFLATSECESALLQNLAEIQAYPNDITLNSVLVLSGTANKVMLSKISESLSILAPERSKEVDKICAKIRRVFEHRNKFAHSAAMGGSDGKIILFTTKSNGIKTHSYNIKQIDEYSKKVFQLTRHLNVIVREVGVKRTVEVSQPRPQ